MGTGLALGFDGNGFVGHGSRRAMDAQLQLLQPALEIHAPVDDGQRFLVVLAGSQLRQRHRQRQVGDHGDQPAAEGQEIEVLAQVLADLAADLVGIGDQVVEGAVFGEPLDGGLGAALLDAGHVVHGVADEGQVIDDEIRRHAELGGHAGLVEDFLAHRVHPAHAGLDELGQILVAGRNHHLPAGRDGLAGERADHVVGLDTVFHQQRPAFGLHGFVQRLDLGAQVVGHRRALGLVVGKPVVAEGLALGIEYAGAVFRLVVGFEPT
jgi:hypothetical protein